MTKHALSAVMRGNAWQGPYKPRAWWHRMLERVSLKLWVWARECRE